MSHSLCSVAPGLSCSPAFPGNAGSQNCLFVCLSVCHMDFPLHPDSSSAFLSFLVARCAARACGLPADCVGSKVTGCCCSGRLAHSRQQGAPILQLYWVPPCQHGTPHLHLVVWHVGFNLRLFSLFHTQFPCPHRAPLSFSVYVRSVYRRYWMLLSRLQSRPSLR